MNMKILRLLSDNAKYSNADIAAMCGITEQEAKQTVEDLEKQGIIRGYKAVIDWDSTDEVYVSALIELKVTPQDDVGFEEIAEQIMRYREVESVYLMSGGYDLCVIVKDKTFKQVASFVSRELATMKGVISTATHFMLRRYKELNIELCGNYEDDRGQVSL